MVGLYRLISVNVYERTFPCYLVMFPWKRAILHTKKTKSIAVLKLWQLVSQNYSVHVQRSNQIRSSVSSHIVDINYRLWTFIRMECIYLYHMNVYVCTNTQAYVCMCMSAYVQNFVSYECVLHNVIYLCVVCI